MSRRRDEVVVAAWVSLARACAEVLRVVELTLKERGLPPLAWYDVLLELKRVPRECIRPIDLQDRLLLEQHNLSRLIDRMEREKLVRRLPCEEDRRGQLIAITREGRALEKKMWPIYRDALIKSLGSNLQDDELELLARQLSKVSRRET
jgi:DNA-binding MarR family transcriptional regulator